MRRGSEPSQRAKSTEKRGKPKDKSPTKVAKIPGSPTKGIAKRKTTTKLKGTQKENTAGTGAGGKGKLSATYRIRQGKEALKTATAIYASIFKTKEVKVKQEKLDEEVRNPRARMTNTQVSTTPMEMDIEKDGLEFAGVKTVQEARKDNKERTIDLTDHVQTETTNNGKEGTEKGKVSDARNDTKGVEVVKKNGTLSGRTDEESVTSGSDGDLQ